MRFLLLVGLEERFDGVFPVLDGLPDRLFEVGDEIVLGFGEKLLAVLQMEAFYDLPGHGAALDDLVLGLVIVGARGIHGHDLLNGDHLGIFFFNNQAGGGLINGGGRIGVDRDGDHDDGKDRDNGPPSLEDHPEVIPEIDLFLALAVFVGHGDI